MIVQISLTGPTPGLPPLPLPLLLPLPLPLDDELLLLPANCADARPKLDVSPCIDKNVL